MQESYGRREQRFNRVPETIGDLAERDAYIAEYKRLHKEAFTPKTIQNIEGTWRAFENWCNEYGHIAKMPVSPLTLSAFVEHCGGKMAFTSVQNHIWAMGELHRAEFLPSPSRHRLVLLSLRAVRRKWGGTVKQAAPLCRYEVMSIIKALGTSRKNIRDKALLLAASDSWCRVSELTAMKVKDIERQSDGTSVISITSSKLGPYGRGEHAFLSRMGTKAVDDWIAVKGLGQDDFIFTGSRLCNGTNSIDQATVTRIFKQLTGRNDVSSHSTRIGGVHDALRLGCSLGSIMVAGRWASPEMPAIYGRKLFASRSAAAEVASAYEE